MRDFIRVSWFCGTLLIISFLTGAVPAFGSDLAQIDALARDVNRAEAIRAVKTLQYSYTQYAQFGLWTDLASLFTDDGEAIYGSDDIKGRSAIAQYNMDKFGGGHPGLPPGVVNCLFVERPLANLSVDGNSVKARWHGFFMLGGSDDARWEGGIFENDYIKDKGVWKISRLHFFPQYAGPYETGWKNVGETLPIVPYHFTPEEAGIPIPPPVGPAPHSNATLATLEQRIAALNAEDKVRNLQNAWGYYIDRKMWDDVTDLFTADSVLEIGGLGIYDGPTNIHRALERNGPAGLQYGELNDHPLFDTVIAISPNGMEARVRGIDLGMLGDVKKGTAEWSVSVFDNRFVKQDGVWKIREMRIFPLFKTDYYQGWGKSRIVDPPPMREFAPDRPVPAADAGDNVIPAFLPNPVTGESVSYPKGARLVAETPLLPSLPAIAPQKPASDVTARITEDERKLAVSKAYDGIMNVADAYGEYLDDSQFPQLGSLFAEQGIKEVPFTGFYIGPEHISHRQSIVPLDKRTSISFHWLIQPVVLIAADGRSAFVRTRMFQPRTNPSGDQANVSNGMDFDQAILEDGIWKLWNVTVDQHHVSYGSYKLGWARLPPPGTKRRVVPGAGGNTNPLPPDIPDSALGKRKEGFIGGPSKPINWPDIMPMWFNYKNPVSGREPSLYWPICGTCEVAPETSMDKHGYLLPQP